MKRKTTKEILAESYLEFAAKKSINKISVVDIVENCSMTKPTFYRHFKDKYDLISWLFVRATKENLEVVFTSEVRQMDEQFCRQSRQNFAGILCGFQADGVRHLVNTAS